ncbi:MAG: multicomponent Na+:H+ antiporter subunit [Gaiellaceae bacterium]|nr:multicomponent Na+:H+ antiporter subunit [Gaiellaceae bacterium]
MNVWLIGATVLLAAFVPCGIVLMRGTHMEALAAVELGGSVAAVDLLLLAEGFHRPVYFGVAVTFAVLSFVGSLLIARVLGKGL